MMSGGVFGASSLNGREGESEEVDEAWNAMV